MGKLSDWVKGRKNESEMMARWTEVINDNSAAARELAESIRGEADRDDS